LYFTATVDEKILRNHGKLLIV